MRPFLKLLLLAGRSWPYPGTTLDMDFLQNRGYIFGRGADQIQNLATFTGAANAYIPGPGGVLVAATAPWTTYDPVTGAGAGSLFEEARTNLFLNSLVNGTNLSTQGVALTAQAYTLSFYGTGTVTLTGAFTGSLVGSGAYPTKSTLTFTPTVGTVTFTVSGTVQYAMLEAGAFASASFIPTAGAAVTRTATSAVMTGTAFSSWYNAAGGTFVAESQLTRQCAVGGTCIVSANDNTTANSISVFYRVTGALGYNVTTSSVSQADMTPIGVLTANTIAKIASAYSANDFATSGNGGAIQTDVAGTVPAVSQISLGISIGNNYLNGTLRRLRYFPTRLANDRLQALSAS